MNVNYERFSDHQNPDYLNFGDFARAIMGLQCQYAARYVDGKLDGWPNLGKGLRFIGNTNNYHSLRIHKKDADEFLKRHKECIQNQMEKPSH